MKFSFGGSTKKYWNQFADNFRSGGEAGKFLDSATATWKGFKNNQQLNNLSNKIIDATPFSDEPGGWLEESKRGGLGSTRLQDWYMDKSRKLSPLWEGGLTHVGGSTADLLKWGEDVAMKSSHHLFGTQIPGYGEDGSSSAATGSGTVEDSDAEDPSLINGGNWQRPGEIESSLRREEGMRKGTLYHDLAKTGSGRQKVKSLA
jgi:hypothetical protein